MSILFLGHQLAGLQYIYEMILFTGARSMIILVFAHCTVVIVWEHACLVHRSLFRVSRSYNFGIPFSSSENDGEISVMNYFMATNSETSSSLILWTWLFILALWARELVEKLFVIRLKSVAVLLWTYTYLDEYYLMTIRFCG